MNFRIIWKKKKSNDTETCGQHHVGNSSLRLILLRKKLQNEYKKLS